MNANHTMEYLISIVKEEKEQNQIAD